MIYYHGKNKTCFTTLLKLKKCFTTLIVLQSEGKLCSDNTELLKLFRQFRGIWLYVYSPPLVFWSIRSISRLKDEPSQRVENSQIKLE
jgi:hypothetical protein